jgi:hypothetical protein
LTQLSSTNFSEIATELQHRCYIKFRYSLFAGPPPYELVSNSAPTVTAHEMETWFTVQIDIARHDLAEGRVFGLTDKDELHLEQLVACAHSKLGPWVRSRRSSALCFPFTNVLVALFPCRTRATTPR